MKKILALATVLLITVFLLHSVSALYSSNAPCSMYRYDLARSGSTVSTAPNSNTTLWISSAPSVGSASVPIVVDGRVFFHSNAKLYALDETTGVKLWETDLPSVYGAIPKGFAYDAGRIYVGTSNYLYGLGFMVCLNASNGIVIWQYELSPSRANTAPAVYGGRVYFGTHDGYIYSLDASTGIFKWRYLTGGAVYSSPAAYDDLLHVGSDDGTLYTFNVSQDLSAPGYVSLWNFTAIGTVRCAPAVDGDMLFFGSQATYPNGTTVYALHRLSGDLIWLYELSHQDPFDGATAIKDGIVYFTTQYFGSRVYALYANVTAGNYTDADPEPRLWSRDLVANSLTEPIVAGDKVLLTTVNGAKLFVLNAQTGSTLWTYDTTGRYPTVADDHAFIEFNDGVLCFGAPYPPVTNHFPIEAGEETFDLVQVTNTTTSNLNTTILETAKTISFTVEGISGSTGMSNVSIPNDLLGGPYTVTVDDEAPWYFSSVENDTHSSLYFTYNGTGPHLVEITGTTVIPEYSTIMFLSLLITIPLVAIIIRNRTRKNLLN